MKKTNMSIYGNIVKISKDEEKKSFALLLDPDKQDKQQLLSY